MANQENTEVKEGLLKQLETNLKEAQNTLTKKVSLNSGVELLISKTKEAVSELVALDSTLTEIQQTSSLTQKELAALGDTAFEVASKYGKSANDFLTTVKEMYQDGFDNAAEMAELTLLTQAASGMDDTSAKAYLTAANEAYALKGKVEELTKVLDGQSNIVDHTALSMQDLASATTEVVSIASKCDVEMDELSAMLAALASNTKESCSEAVKAVSTIFTCLQDTSNENITEVLDSVNISMTKISNGSEVLKTPIELLKELSNVYTGLAEGSSLKTDILSIGGAANGDALSAILSDWSAYEDMLALYSQGSGSAAKLAEENTSEIQDSLTRLSNTFTDTIGNIADSEVILAVVNALNGLLTPINRITDALGSWGSIGLGAGLFAGIKNVGREKCYPSHGICLL